MGDPDRQLADELDRIEQSDIPDVDKEAIVATVDELRTGSMATSTVQSYAAALRVLSRCADGSLTDLDTGGMNDLLDDLADQREWADSTLCIKQSAVKAFVDHRGDDPDDVDITTVSQNGPDPRSILTEEEFHELRESAPNLRDKALIDLLGFTGQRLRVVACLTVGDVDVDEGIWYMPDVKGLKGAGKVGKKRPLLGARKTLGEWLECHPTGDPDDHLITPLPSAANSTPGDMMADTSINERLMLVRDRAGVDKKCNPHQFRHHFVTVASKRYDMDDATIRHLIGHSADSRVMETTYRHLGDDDHIEAAEEAFGIREEGQQTRAPPVCPSCNRPLRPQARECPTAGCVELFGADEPETELEQLAVELDEKIQRYAELKGVEINI